MICPSPRVANVSEQEMAVQVSFKMDAVDLERSSFQLRYIADPFLIPTNTSCTALPGDLLSFSIRIQVRRT